MKLDSFSIEQKPTALSAALNEIAARFPCTAEELDLYEKQTLEDSNFRYSHRFSFGRMDFETQQAHDLALDRAYSNICY